MAFSQRFPADGERLAAKRLGLGVLGLVTQEGGQVAETDGRMGMVFSQRLLPDGQRLAKERRRLGIAAALIEVFGPGVKSRRLSQLALLLRRQPCRLPYRLQ